MSNAPDTTELAKRASGGPEATLIDSYISDTTAERATTASEESTTLPGPPRFDEMLGNGDQVRPGWHEVATGLNQIGSSGLLRLRNQVNRLLENDGVTYTPIARPESRDRRPEEPALASAAQQDSAQQDSGQGESDQRVTAERSAAETEVDEPNADQSAAAGMATVARQQWKLDPVPLVVEPADWAVLEAGLTQRATLLDLILTDIYGPRTLIRRGFIPPELIFGNPGYLRRAHGMVIPGAHQLFFYAADIFRAPDGQFVALADRTQAPSGAGFAMADRRVVSRVSPDIYRRAAPHGLGAFFRTLRLALQSVAPRGTEDPRVVVLTPGTHSETAFDQAFTASLLGYPLVESADLTVRDGCLWMRSLGRYEQVDVVLRRVDAGYCDPLDLRPDSQLGVVGLLQSCRRGNVSVVNTFGSGVLENPGLLPYLPLLAETLLSEELKLPSVPTFWCGVPTSLSHVLANFETMVMRPTDRAKRSVVVDRLDRASREMMRDQVNANPDQWVGQPFATYSQAPVGTADGLRPRQVDMRLFAVAHQGGYVAMPGGLGRVLTPDAPTAVRLGPDQAAAQRSGLERSFSQKLATTTEAKDIWISSGIGLTAGSKDGIGWLQDGPLVRPNRNSAATSPRVLEDLFWFGRYTERVEDFTRLLMTARDRYDEFRYRTGVPGAGLVPVLLKTVTIASATYPGFTRLPADAAGGDVLAEMRSLMLNRYRRGTIAQGMAGLEEAASGVRDQLSGDTWMVLAGVQRALTELAADHHDQGATLQTTHAAVLSGMLALAGLASENMIRDPGWHLMDIGRRLERSLQLLSVMRSTLAVAHSPEVDSLLIESVLMFAESILTYRRRYRGRTQIGTVLQLLLLDVGNPRSLAYQLEMMAADFKALPDATGTSVPERLLEQRLAHLRRCDATELDHADPDGARAALVTFLSQAHAGLSELADAIAEQHFWQPGAMQPLYLPRAQKRQLA